jgi:hypothetical protein
MHSQQQAARPELDAETRRRLGLIAGRLGSSFDGERLAALDALDRVLGPRGLRIGDLLAAAAAPPPAGPPPLPHDAEARELLRRIAESGWRPDPWEAGFLASVRAWRSKLSEKQLAKIAEIAARAGVR